jgi:SAM-dependent methyltransferase
VSLKGAFEDFVPPALQGPLGGLAERWLHWRYLRGGSIPWSAGYEVHKTRFIASALADATLARRFRDGEPLPHGYGVGLDERCVEYPWALARLSDRRETLLDAGSTLNHVFVLDQPVLQRKQVHILTLAPEAACFWTRGVSYVFGDLRSVPIRDSFYDVCLCLSTLEHIGCDNTAYTGEIAHREERPDDFILAMTELRRVLKPGGVLLLTVPFGRARDYGTFRQFDRALLSRAVDCAGGWSARSEAFYRYTPAGWTPSSVGECAGSEYVDWVARPREAWPDPLPVEADRAAAARAVACLQLVK